MQEEIIYEDLQISEVQDDITVEEIVPVIEVTDVETFDIEVSEAFPAYADVDALNHAILNNRELRDQHPITAITGLRKELDSIEALQTVYSDKKGNADYYEWADGHALGENGVGYFVSLNRDCRTISICSGDDIFGVVVDGAAFVGGQDGVTLDYVNGAVDTHGVARGAHYGLVATTGAVHVRCELNVAEGDYVVSNAKGVATKSSSGRGYKVVALHDIKGVPHAMINLNISADQIDLMGAELKGLDSRMDAAETNIVSAINVANEAYKKAAEAGNASIDASNKAQDALDTSNRVLDSVGSLENAATQSQIIAAQAKAIADGVMVSAEAMCQEAINEANEALAEAEKIREDFGDIIDNIDGDIGEAISNMQKLKEDLEPLATWSNDDKESIAGFVARADEDSATLATMVEWKDGTGTDSLAGFVQNATSENAEVQALASYGYKDDNGVQHYGAAGIMAEVDKNKSAIEAIVGKDGDIAGLQAQIDNNKSAVNIVAQRIAKQYIVVALEKDIDATKTGIVYYVEKTKEYHYYDNNAWKKTSDAAAAGLPTSIAGIQAKTDDNSASINSLVSWQGDTNTAMARIEQKADANGAYIQSTVANMDKYSVGPHSQAYGFTLEQAASVLEEGMIYVPTTSHTETYKYTDTDTTIKEQSRSFTPQYLYKWGKIGERYGWITVDKNYSETTETNTSAKAVYFTTTVPTVSGNFGYWYTDGENATEGYESYTLYKWSTYATKDNDGKDTTGSCWVPVATLAGNSQSRAVSQIRQDANSIELDVTNVKGDLAGIKIWAGDDFSAIQDTVTWRTNNGEAIATTIQRASDSEAYISQVASVKNPDGTVNAAASIVTAVNNSESSVMINADHIKFDGFVSFANKSDVDGVKESAVYDTKVEYALSSSLSSFVKVTDWSTVAPVRQADTYMWQRTTITKGDGTITEGDPTCIHGADGDNGTSIVWKGTYASAPSSPQNGWAYYNSTDKKSYVYQNGWSQMTADGTSGLTPYIKDKYWWVGDSNTGVKAEGSDGTTPTVSISTDGYWVINNTKTTVKAVGTDAPKVISEKKQFYLSTSNTSLAGGSWSDSPSGFTKGKYLWTRTVYTMDKGDPICGAGVLDKTYTTISGWCSANNETLIDGANIATGTVTADQIDTSTLIVGENITMGSAAKISWDNVDGKPDVVSASEAQDITRTVITSETIVAPNLTAGKITVNNTSGKPIFNADASSNSVTLGGFTIGQYALYNGKPSFNSTTPGVYLGTDGIGSGPFYVNASNGAGKIGGWNILEDKLYHSTTSNIVGLYGGSNSYYQRNGSTIRFYAGGSSMLDCPFTVTQNGSLYASKGDIAGWEIDTNSLIKMGEEEKNKDGTSTGLYHNSLMLANSTQVSEYAIAIGTYNSTFTDDNYSTRGWNSAAFRVGLNGRVTASSINTQNWTINGSEISYKPGGLALKDGCVKLSGFSIYKDDNTLGSDDLWIKGNKCGFMIREPITASDGTGITLKWTHDWLAGLTFTATLDKAPSQDFTVDIYWNVIHEEKSNIFESPVVARDSFTLNFVKAQRDSTNSKHLSFIDMNCNNEVDYLGLGLSAEAASSDAVAQRNAGKNGRNCDSGSSYNFGGATVYFPSSNQGTNYSRTHLCPSEDNSYDLGAILETNVGGNNRRWRNAHFSGTVYRGDCQSDIRVKNSVSVLPIEYESFFDKMEPTRYKYNEGTSDRYHTGFIAQQLVSALEESGLTTQDFAGVMLDLPGTEYECWYLRRDEFVALNTWQIQKLKARTVELEAKVIELEDKLAKLTID